MAQPDSKLVEAVEKEVIQDILPMIENPTYSEPDDPQKLWVILHYSDKLRVSEQTLSDLLDALSSCPDESPDESLCMDQFEWTLSSRINYQVPMKCCHDTSTLLGTEKKDAIIPEPMPIFLTPVELDSTKKAVAFGESSATMSTGYFCKTAKVYHPTFSKKSSSCHHVTEQTETVIVDLRYKFDPIISVSTGSVLSMYLLDDIADKVRDIVINILDKDNKDIEYRVCVLKPQRQTNKGASPMRCESPSQRGSQEAYTENLTPFQPLQVPHNNKD